MTTREAGSALVQRMQECFNSRQFDHADELFTPGFFSHPLGTTGFERARTPGASSSLWTAGHPAGRS